MVGVRPLCTTNEDQTGPPPTLLRNQYMTYMSMQKDTLCINSNFTKVILDLNRLKTNLLAFKVAEIAKR